MSARNLKIERSGDAYKGNVVPKIRLAGKWLHKAGFPPGSRVQVIATHQGVLELRLQPIPS